MAIDRQSVDMLQIGRTERVRTLYGQRYGTVDSRAATFLDVGKLTGSHRNLHGPGENHMAGYDERLKRDKFMTLKGKPHIQLVTHPDTRTLLHSQQLHQFP